jgi:hypothetical protein
MMRVLQAHEMNHVAGGWTENQVLHLLDGGDLSNGPGGVWSGGAGGASGGSGGAQNAGLGDVAKWVGLNVFWDILKDTYNKNVGVAGNVPPSNENDNGGSSFGIGTFNTFGWP